jgi:hypothetical protein
VQIAQGVLWVKTSSSGLVHPTLSHSLLELGFSSSQVDPSLFVYHTKGSHIFLLVYVDDIIVIGNNAATMQSLIAKLQADFAMKDLGPLSYFKPYQTPCITGSRSRFDGDVLPNPTEYCHIVDALQYGTLTRLDIAYSINRLCQHMHQPTSVHWTIAKGSFST